MKLKSTLYKGSGIYGRTRAVGAIITGFILIFIGLFFGIGYSSLKAFSVFLIFGLIIIIYGFALWKRCASLVKGKFR